MKTWLFVLLAAATVLANAQEVQWLSLGTAANGVKWSMAKDRTKVVRPLVLRAWLKAEMPKPERTSDGKVIAYNVLQIEVDCARETIEILMVHLYTPDGENLAGMKPPNSAAHAPVPGSMEDTFASATCEAARGVK